MKLREYISPETIEEAYNILIKSKNNLILGGGCFLGMSRRKKI